MTQYYITDLWDKARTGIQPYTWEEVLKFFRPGDEPELEEYRNRFEEVENLQDLIEYLDWEAAGMAIKYEITAEGEAV